MIERKTVSQCVSEDYCKGWNDAVDAMPKWISVEDRLPEDDQDVLVCVNKNTIDTGYCSFGYDPSVRNWYAYASVSNNVTHWMPLPEPPKEDAHENHD